ncbi:MAG TPA: YaiO family outer membrane beta-barrel protein [Blastocatellia bacterium]|nr:YaiO family outer membrane beta-barrel protein [Blastocatellia bacterium]
MRFRPIVTLAVLLLLSCAVQAQALSSLHRWLTSAEPASRLPLAAATPHTPAVGAETKTWSVGTEFSYETLSGGLASWYSAQFNLSREFAAGRMVYGSYRETSRFSRYDREATAGMRQAFGKKWAVQTEASFSPTHQVLAQWTFLTQIERQFERGWVSQAGFRHSAFNTKRAQLGIVSVERYWSRYRAAYTLYTGAAGNSGVSMTHRVSGNYFYGARNSLGLGAAWGRELVNLGTRGLLRTNVRAVTLHGRHWFNARWTAIYGVTWHEQGSLYVRRGLTFGLSRQF